MTLGEFREYTMDLDDDIEIFHIIGDHEAVPMDVTYWFVAKDKKGRGASEFFGIEHLYDNQEKVPALIMS